MNLTRRKRIIVNILIVVALALIVKGIEIAIGSESDVLWTMFFVLVIAVQHMMMSRQKSLVTGETMEIKGVFRKYQPMGGSVVIDGATPADGIITLKNENLRYLIENGKIIEEFRVSKFRQNDGVILELDGTALNGITRGSKGWVNNAPAPDGIYKTGFLSSAKIENGLVVWKKFMGLDITSF